MSPHADDAALVAAARSGSDAAFARIVDRYQGPVRSFLRRICINEADADDLAQEVFLSAWTRLRLLQDAARLKSWLFGIAWRQSKMRDRSMARTRPRDQAGQELQDDRTDSAQEMNLALQQALAELTPEQRAGVALCLAGGWSHAEAAEVLDMPLGTLKSHVSRGRARLVAVLGVGE
jgi:RNA polymerase sigma factor (sigma-70 family)